MKANEIEDVHRAGIDCPNGGAVVEIRLLVEPGLLTALEAAACQRGVTAATMVRRLLRDFLTGGNNNQPAS
jgi:hypothetical protein